jgi:hypothetical protein
MPFGDGDLTHVESSWSQSVCGRFMGDEQFSAHFWLFFTRLGAQACVIEG